MERIRICRNEIKQADDKISQSIWQNAWKQNKTKILNGCYQPFQEKNKTTLNVW